MQDCGDIIVQQIQIILHMLIGYYIVSDELIKILSKLSKEELNKAHFLCKHYYHTETISIMSIDT